MSSIHIVYVLIPIVSALIGWITNFIAVKMIFRPRHPITILGFKIHGLIPKRQIDLAHNLGDLIERELISHQDIQQVLQSEDVINSSERIISAQVDRLMAEKLASLPMVAMFLQGDIATKVKDLLVAQLCAGIPEFLDTCMRHVEEKLDFKKIVQQKVEAFDYVKLEEIVYRIAAKELKTIELLGAMLGFAVGVAQVGMLIAFGQP